MKRWLIILVVLLWIPIQAQGKEPGEILVNEMEQEIEKGIEYQIGALDLVRWENFLKELERQGNPMLDNFTIKDFIRQLLRGEFKIDGKEILQQIGQLFFREIAVNMGFMAKIIVISIICGILNHLKASFSSASVGELAWFACYIMVIILIIQSLSLIFEVGRKSMDQMAAFMHIIFPTLLALLIGMGGIASSGIIQPATALLAGMSGTFLKNIMIPLIFFTAVLILVNNINDSIQLDRMCDLFKKLCTWVLGIIFTIFIGVLTIQGILAASFDGISIRTTKYAMETFIPIVGGMFSKAIDVLIGCSLLVKNAVGAAGLIIVAILCIYPSIKILSLIIVYKFAGAVLQPITDKRIVSCLNDIGNIVTILFVTVAGIGMMFFMTIALLMGTGNITVMMR